MNNQNEKQLIEETEEERKTRLKSPIGAADFILVKEKCPEIPETFLMQLMFGGR